MASRFWVGGTGTWDASDTSHWSDSTGGASGSSVPTLSDTVNFDAASGGGTCTISAASVPCATLTLTGYTGVLAYGTNKISITAPSATTVFSGDTTYTVSGTPNIEVVGSTYNITIAGAAATEGNSINFTMLSGSGTKTVTGSVKSLIFNSGCTGALANSARTVYGSFTIASGMTTTAGANVTTYGATSGTQTITSNGVTLDYPHTVSGAGGTVQLADAFVTGSTRTFTHTAGTLNLNNNSLTAGLFSSDNTNTRVLTSGTGQIYLIGIGTIWNTATATNLTYTTVPTVNVTTNTASSRTIATGTATNAEIDLNVTAGTGNLSCTASNVYRHINFAGSSVVWSNTNNTLSGNLTLSATMTFGTGSTSITFGGGGTQTLTTNDAPVNRGVVVANGTTLDLVGHYINQVASTRPLQVTQGTFNANNYNVTVSVFTFTGILTRTVNMGSGCWTVYSTGTVWNVSGSGYTINCNTSTIAITSSGAATFAGASNTYYGIAFAGAGAVTISGSNAFTNWTNWVSPTSVLLTVATTQTVTNFLLRGAPGRLFTLTSTTSAVTAILSKASGTSTSEYVSLRDITASGGATWNALNSTDVSGNINWNFSSENNLQGKGFLGLLG